MKAKNQDGKGEWKEEEIDYSSLVPLARKAIEYYFHTRQEYSPTAGSHALNRKRGVFVTLHSYPSMELRGCIGFTEPMMPLREAAVKAALSAAFSDPRFPQLSFSELNEVIVEVSVLTEPKIILAKNCDELKKKIVIGKHGLMAENNGRSGLLLPQVPVEWKWDVEGFLENTCLKAGLSKDSWKDSKTKFLSFEGAVFREKKPGGKIVNGNNCG